MPRSQSAQSLNTRYVDSNPAVHREQPVNTSQNRVKMSEIQTMQTLQETVDTPVPATTGNRELFPFASILISSSSSSYHNDGVLSDDGMADVRRRKRFNRPSGNASDGDDGFAPTPQAMIEQAVNNPVLTQTESDSDDALDADYSSGARRRLRRSVLKGFVPNQGVTQSQPAFTPREREPSVVAPIQPELDDKKIKRYVEILYNFISRQRTVGQAVPREMSRVERESARKRRHNIVEQNRRILVNHTLDQLRHIIPTLNNKTPKAITLFSTVEYIKKILEDQGNMKAQLQSIDVPLPKECFESPPPPSTIGAPAAVPIKKSSLETSPKNLPKPAPAPLVMSKDKEPISAPATPKNAAYTNPMPLRVVQLRSENVVANPLTFNDRGAVSIGPAGAVRRSVSVPDGLSSWQHPPRKVMPQVSVTVPLPTAAARRDIDANQHVHHDVTLAAELKAASPVRLAPESRHRNVVEASGRVAVARDDGEDDDDDEFVVVD